MHADRMEQIADQIRHKPASKLTDDDRVLYCLISDDKTIKRLWELCCRYHVPDREMPVLGWSDCGENIEQLANRLGL